MLPLGRFPSAEIQRSRKIPTKGYNEAPAQALSRKVPNAIVKETKGHTELALKNSQGAIGNMGAVIDKQNVSLASHRGPHQNCSISTH